MPSGGQRDVVHDFNADVDHFVFDGGEFTQPVDWELINFGGQDIILVSSNGEGSLDANNDGIQGDYAGWEMAIQVTGLTGTLGNNDFVVV